MANLLTRRLALFRIASVAGASVVAAPVALAAVQPKTSENPELIELGQSLIAEAENCIRLRQIRDEARGQVMNEWPALPLEVRVGKFREQVGTENEEDCDDQPINRGGPYHRSIYEHYHSARHLTERLAELPERSGTASQKLERQALKRLLPIAAGYKSAKAAAMPAHDYAAKLQAFNFCEHRVEQLISEIGSLPALTPDGITIKAQAYQACGVVGKEQRFLASIHLGPSIADDVCRVLSEGDEA